MAPSFAGISAWTDENPRGVTDAAQTQVESQFSSMRGNQPQSPRKDQHSDSSAAFFHYNLYLIVIGTSVWLWIPQS